MNESTIAESLSDPQSASLSDLAQLWGDLGQAALADDEATRAHYLTNECPLLLLPDETIWLQPLCA